MNNKIDYCINDFIKEIKLPQYEGVINKSIVDWAVKLAYKDAQRTMIGIYKYEKEKNAALNEITENITMYFKKTEPFASPEEFDEMHESLCDIWTKAFDSTIIGTYGRAQKIVNMTFKYLYCIDYHKKNIMNGLNFAILLWILIYWIGCIKIYKYVLKLSSIRT